MAGQMTQCPQAERTRRSLPSHGPPVHRPVSVSLFSSTMPGVDPALRTPDQRWQVAQRFRAADWTNIVGAQWKSERKSAV